MTTQETAGAARLLGLLGLLGVGLLGAAGVAAQPVATPGIAVHRYHEPGEPVIAVDVWGSIRQTGRFYIAPDTGLLELLALAGGPPLQPETEQVNREVILRLSRLSGGERRVVFEANVDSLSSGGVVPPPLLNEDLITVNSTVDKPFTWQDGLTIVAGVASLTLLILRITDMAGGF
jgi:hypothetical protein